MTVGKVDPSRRGDWMTTYTGRVVYPFDFDAHTMWHPRDTIEHHAKECRYSGMCEGFYSVATHCVLGARLILRKSPADLESALAFLFHEVDEAYFRDLPPAVKRSPEYEQVKVYQKRVQEKVFDRLGIAMNEERRSLIKRTDLILLASEKEALSPFRTQEEPWVLPEPPDRLVSLQVSQSIYGDWHTNRSEYSQTISAVVHAIRSRLTFSTALVEGADYLDRSLVL